MIQIFRQPLMLLLAVLDNEDFFILPGRDILDNINNFYDASYGDPGKPSNMPARNYGPLTQYKDNWLVFDK